MWGATKSGGRRERETEGGSQKRGGRKDRNAIVATTGIMRPIRLLRPRRAAYHQTSMKAGVTFCRVQVIALRVRTPLGDIAGALLERDVVVATATKLTTTTTAAAINPPPGINATADPPVKNKGSASVGWHAMWRTMVHHSGAQCSYLTPKMKAKAHLQSRSHL